MPSSKGSSRGFAPAFARKSKYDNESERDEGFAPAFKKTSKQDEYGDFQKMDYQFMRTREFGSEPLGPWNNWGVKTDEEESKDAKELFVSVDEIMNHDYAPHNAFEYANKSALGLGSNSQTVVNEIGGQAIGSVKRQREDRLQYLDERGRFRDGMDRGQIPKRLLEEHAHRVRQWRNEMAHANAVMQAWDSLTLEEQEQRREDARFNMAEMLKALRLEVEEALPEEYQYREADTSESIELENEDELPLFVDDFDIGKSPANSAPSSSPKQSRDGSPFNTISPSPTASATSSPRRSHGVSPFNIRQSQVPVIRPLNDIGRDVREGSSGAIGSYYTSLAARSRVPTGYEQCIPSVREPRDSTTWRPPTGPKQWRAQPKSRRGRRYHAPPPVPASPSTRSTKTETSLFSVEKFPDILPLEDVEESIMTSASIVIPDSSMKKYWKIYGQSVIKGRLVIIQLHRNLNFSLEAVTGRIFGGQVQEYQCVVTSSLQHTVLTSYSRFFPADSQALVAFFYPWEAEAFITHVNNARHNDHEFRRLQLAAHWYKGDEGQSKFGIQRGIIKHVLAKDASRILHVKRIDKRISHGVLEQLFKDKFPNLVRVMLIVPKKLYERESVNSNSVVLEFSSKFLTFISFNFVSYSSFNLTSKESSILPSQSFKQT